MNLVYIQSESLNVHLNYLVGEDAELQGACVLRRDNMFSWIKGYKLLAFLNFCCHFVLLFNNVYVSIV